MRVVGAAAAVMVGLAAAAEAAPQERPIGGFVLEKTYTFPANPEQVWEGLTGDVSEWWDHTFSGDPHRLYIDARPGGGFYEIYDESGDGVEHARVIGAKRNEMLRLQGPLGFAGHAVDFVYTLTLEEKDGGTQLELLIRGSGELEDGWPDALDRVWDHFLGVRLRAWLAGELPGE